MIRMKVSERHVWPGWGRSIKDVLEDANGRFKIELVRLGVLGEGRVGAPIRDVFSIGKMPSTGIKYSR